MMKNGTINLLKLFLIFVLLALPCTSAQADTSTQSYVSPLGNFSVLIPHAVGQRTQQQNDNNGGIVAFHDDFGNYKSIFYLRLSPKSLELRKDAKAH